MKMKKSYGCKPAHSLTCKCNAVVLKLGEGIEPLQGGIDDKGGIWTG